jgi:cystathionine beta-lyase
VKWQAFGPDVIPAWIAEMDFALAEPIAAMLHDAINRSDTGYAWTGEVGEALGVFSATRWNWIIDPEQVMAVGDVLTGVSHVLISMTNPGESVVINSPVYPPFFTTVTDAAQRALVDVPLIWDGSRYTFNQEKMEEAFSRSDVTAYLMCSPHNPTGRVFDQSEMQFIADLAKKYQVLVVADEIHAPITHLDYEFIPYLAIAGEEPAVSVISASKAWNIAGLRCAQVVSSSKQLHKTLTDSIPIEVQQSSGHLGALAAVTAYTQGAPWLDAMLAHLETQVTLLRGLLDQHLPDVSFTTPQASFLAWLDCRALDLGLDPAAHFLNQSQVALNSGPTFGPSGAGFARLNFATSAQILEEIVIRMARTITKND